MANEWIVYPCYTHVSFQMNAISLCVIILSSIKILATIPLFMLSLHNSFMLLCLAVLSCAVALAVAVYRLILSSVLASLLALYPTSPPGFTLLSPALRPRHSLPLTLNSLTIYFIRMYVCMCVCAMLFTAGWFDGGGGGSLIVILLDFAFNWLSTACGVAKFAEHIYCQIHFLSTIYQSPCFLLLMLSLLFTRLLFLLLFWFENDKKSEWFGWNKALFCWFIKSVFVYYYFASFCKFSILNDVMMK